MGSLLELGLIPNLCLWLDITGRFLFYFIYDVIYVNFWVPTNFYED